MTDLVDHTLQMWRQTKFAWGQRDCLLSISDYLVMCGAPDIGQRFRGTYDSEAGAHAIIEAHGGIAPLIDLSGVRQIEPGQVQRGDVVVIDPRDDTDRFGVCGLCTGGLIAFRAERSVIEVRSHHLMMKNAWSVGTCRE